MPRVSSPSASLVRSARSEIARLNRARASVEQRRSALLAEVDELDSELAGYERREDLLRELADLETPEALPMVRAERALKGIELRRVAGRLLWSAQGEAEIHYREWFERVLAAGYAVGGKDPSASFLTNVRDSPAVVRGSRPGFYRLDASQRQTLEQEVAELEAELADVVASLERSFSAPADATQVEALRSHRHDLERRLRRTTARFAELRAIFESSTAETELQAA